LSIVTIRASNPDAPPARAGGFCFCNLHRVTGDTRISRWLMPPSLQIPDLTRFLHANRFPLRLKTL
jgi:hypothetical protein